MTIFYSFSFTVTFKDAHDVVDWCVCPTEKQAFDFALYCDHKGYELVSVTREIWREDCEKKTARPIAIQSYKMGKIRD